VSLTLQFRVPPDGAGVRFDAAVLARCPESTRPLVRRAIEAGTITLNGQPADKGIKLRAGDEVAVQRLLAAADVRVEPDARVPIQVLFADEGLLAVNKPAGLAVHPLRPGERGTLANGLVACFPELAEVGDQPLMAGVVHRIDTDTSGLVLAARTQAVHDALRAQFRAQTVRKTYLALVEGRVRGAGRLTHDLVHLPSDRGRMVDARGLQDPERRMRAVTDYQPQRRVGNRTLLEVTIFTGVTHQIRCQLALAGHPVVGDTRYGALAVAGFNRHFLHAAAIAFTHPGTGRAIDLHAPLTPDLDAFLRSKEDL
jgi:23S rRNA pseudouridine1911/1915/1917 synthase